jgi:hypothetical protein
LTVHLRPCFQADTARSHRFRPCCSFR